jgi:hypothetical protein
MTVSHCSRFLTVEQHEVKLADCDGRVCYLPITCKAD